MLVFSECYAAEGGRLAVPFPAISRPYCHVCYAKPLYKVTLDQQERPSTNRFSRHKWPRGGELTPGVVRSIAILDLPLSERLARRALT